MAKSAPQNPRRQQITAWTTLRNFADHGKFDEYTAQQVGSMISDVRSFLATHLKGSSLVSGTCIMEIYPAVALRQYHI